MVHIYTVCHNPAVIIDRSHETESYLCPWVPLSCPFLFLLWFWYVVHGLSLGLYLSCLLSCGSWTWLTVDLQGLSHWYNPRNIQSQNNFISGIYQWSNKWMNKRKKEWPIPAFMENGLQQLWFIVHINWVGCS